MNILTVCKAIILGEYIHPTTRQEVNKEYKNLQGLPPNKIQERIKRLRLGRFAMKKLRRKNPFRGIVGPRVAHDMRWVAPPQFEKECILRS